jgi:hypothetical protein
LSKDTVVLENYAEVPRIERYGLHDAANEARVDKFVFDWLGFRVPVSGVDIHLHDTGDDSSSKDYFLVWVTDEDAARIRALFAE